MPYQEETYSISKKRFICFIFPLCVVIFFIAATVIRSSMLVSTGEQLRTMETQKFTLLQEQKELRSQLVSSQSLSAIREIAQKEGYVAISSLSYVRTSQPVANAAQ